jgi:hypothetical protein
MTRKRIICLQLLEKSGLINWTTINLTIQDIKSGIEKTIDPITLTFRSISQGAQLGGKGK